MYVGWEEHGCVALRLASHWDFYSITFTKLDELLGSLLAAVLTVVKETREIIWQV